VSEVVDSELVKVLIYPAEYECPYSWEYLDRPWSIGFPPSEAQFERECHKIPRDMHERWVQVDRAFGQRQDEMDALVKSRRR
jgi:hypothetical protein